MASLQCKYGLFDTVSERCDVSASLRNYGEWAERRLSIMRRFAGPGSIVADVGAHIGGHAIALARLVGDGGRVYAVESRPAFASILRSNIALNRLEPVVVLHEDSLEALEPPRLDLVNVGDVGHLPEQDLVALMTRYRAVITLAHWPDEYAASLFVAADSAGYLAFGRVDYAFNPENYRGCTDNIWGDRRYTTLVLVPAEKAPSYDLGGVRPVRGLDEMLALFRDMPPAHIEVAGPRESLAAPDGERSNGAFAIPDERPSVHVVVPFYKKEELVEQIFASLDAIADELLEIGAKVFFYNDSPEYAPLQHALDRCRFDNSAIEFKVMRNDANLGFIGTCNAAFDRAKRERADVILLNSDTIVFPGALREMLQVGLLDPMIGFVSPRSNNATIATLPYSSLNCDTRPEDGYADFIRVAAHLPRFSFVPTAVGFCLLVKWAIFGELGAFDPIYGMGYNEENDLILRANRCGYRAVLANHAFVWHQGEQSFGESAQARIDREEKNAPVLQGRYPEYLPLIHAYFDSPEFRAEDLVSYVDEKGGQRKIAFDFSNFGSYHNGTFESGIRLVEAAARNWPSHVRIAVYMEPGAWKFHALNRIPGVERLDVHDSHAKVSAIVRVGQPFDADSVMRVVTRAPVVGIFMLDTISYDCGYLARTFDDRVWRYVFGQIDVLFTNSRYTLDRIATRFPIGRRVLQCVSRHSLDTTEYASPSDDAVPDHPHIFVIGNHFSHKFVKPAADAIAAAHPDRKIVAVGYGDDPSPHGNIVAYESGNLSDETFERFYRDAEAVIFPSHYEGFGFPILHAIARKRPIYVRESALYRELAQGIEGAENIRYFRTLDDLVADLRERSPRWETPSKAGEKGGWDRSAREVLHALEQARTTVSYEALVERLRQIDLLMSATVSPTLVPTAARRVARKVEMFVERLLRVPGVESVARRGWRSVRRLRRR
ncbi:glycosyltransferase [Burkholderia ubonensis]|uniref:glycosyltransferase n=1 Tax=Burkholderia ubonensis TaxID=101571 RepID=UPI000AFAFD96|nr:glycosyltransferase [Burkholderia ubonensis]